MAGGTEPLVDACQRPYGHAVLKLGLPDNLEAGSRALPLAEGRGYVHQYAYLPEDDALRLERRGGMLTEAERSTQDQIGWTDSAKRL